MTFEDLDQEFPNGFVDAEMTGIVVDFSNRSVTLRLNLRGNLPDSPGRDEYAPATLVARDIFYISVEPPDREHLLSAKRSHITVDGFSEDSDSFPLFAHLRPGLSAGAFCCRFYVHDWNSFIHLAARSADFSWDK